MKCVCLALVLGCLPATGLSAPPQRCDDVPRAVTFPQSPYVESGVPPIEPHSPVAEATRRQRIQILKDRIHTLKPKFENPPPPPTTIIGPSQRIEPPVVVPETSPSDSSSQSTSPLPEIPPVFVELDPDLSSLPVQPSELVPLPEPVLQPVPDTELQPVPKPELQPVPPPVPDPAPQPEPQPAVEQEPPPSVPRSPLLSAPEQKTPIPAPPVTHGPPIREDSPLTLPSELLDQTIDRQRMGNNLYAIGAYELALMNYEKMLQQPLSPVETQWVQFQVANCQRHLGQLALAQKAYRRVAGETSEEWLGQMSRWWLKELDDREQLQRRVSELDVIIKTLDQELSRDK